MKVIINKFRRHAFIRLCKACGLTYYKLSFSNALYLCAKLKEESDSWFNRTDCKFCCIF